MVMLLNFLSGLGPALYLHGFNYVSCGVLLFCPLSYEENEAKKGIVAS